jgi:hypothetical protein
MVNRAGKLIAEWNLQMDCLAQAIATPPSDVGRFRMSNKICGSSLWKQWKPTATN